jgi:hypothetical protein
VGFTADAGKFFYFLLILFLTLCYWTFFGIQNVQITPSLAIANVRRGRRASASTSPLGSAVPAGWLQLCGGQDFISSHYHLIFDLSPPMTP